MNKLTLSVIDEATFDAMLGVVPPLDHQPLGFLVGEAASARACGATGNFSRTYDAFFSPGGGKFYTASKALTRTEFRHVLITGELKFLTEAADEVAIAHQQEGG